MKKRIIQLIFISLCLAVGFILNSCTDFLEQAPISEITPEMYFNNDAQVSSYVINCYNIIPTGNSGTETTADLDETTDNQGSKYFGSKMLRFTPTQFKVADVGGDWDFNEI